MGGGAKEGVVHGVLVAGLIWRLTESLEEYFEGPLRGLLKELLQRQFDDPFDERWRSRYSYYRNTGGPLEEEWDMSFEEQCMISPVVVGSGRRSRWRRSGETLTRRWRSSIRGMWKNQSSLRNDVVGELLKDLLKDPLRR